MEGRGTSVEGQWGCAEGHGRSEEGQWEAKVSMPPEMTNRRVCPFGAAVGVTHACEGEEEGRGYAKVRKRGRGRVKRGEAERG